MKRLHNGFKWSALAAVLAALAAGPAQAYAEFGYYSGAYATPGESGCWGSDGQGTNPYGGCTPGTFPLTSSTAFVYGLRGVENYASVTANLATASIVGSSHFPGGASNSPGSAGNFLDTFTVVGDLPAPVSVLVTLTIDSTLIGSLAAGGAPLRAELMNGGGLQAGYDRQLDGSTCYWSIYGGFSCDVGDGHLVRTITHVETVDDLHRSFQTAAVLYLGGNYLAIDASATLSLTLPTGLSYTSASGVFPAAAVPEPQTWALMLAGAALIGRLARRRGPG